MEATRPILATKLKDDYQQLGLDRWIRDKQPEPPPRLRELEQRWEQMVEKMVSVLDLGPRPDGDTGTG